MMNQLPIDDWKAFLKLKVLNGMATALGSSFVTESFNFNNRFLGGQIEETPRWEQVFESIKNDFDDAISEQYIKRHFSPEAKNHAIEIAENVRSALAEHIGNAVWMCDSTRTKALKKLNHMRLKIGYPPQWVDYSSYFFLASLFTS